MLFSVRFFRRFNLFLFLISVFCCSFHGLLFQLKLFNDSDGRGGTGGRMSGGTSGGGMSGGEGGDPLNARSRDPLVRQALFAMALPTTLARRCNSSPSGYRTGLEGRATVHPGSVNVEVMTIIPWYTLLIGRVVVLVSLQWF